MSRSKLGEAALELLISLELGEAQHLQCSFFLGAAWKGCPALFPMGRPDAGRAFLFWRAEEWSQLCIDVLATECLRSRLLALLWRRAFDAAPSQAARLDLLRAQLQSMKAAARARVGGQ